MQISTETTNIENLEVDGIIVGYHLNGSENGTASRLAGQLADVLSLGDLTGKKGQISMIYNVDEVTSKRVVLVGLDEKSKCNPERVRLAASKAVRKFRKLGVKNIAIEALNNDAQSTAEGVILGLYRFDELMKKDEELRKTLESVIFSGTNDQITSWNKGVIIGNSQNISRRLSELPANIGTPTYFCDHTEEVLEGVEKVEIFTHSEEWAKEKNMGCFLSVAAGTDEPAKFLEIRYQGGNEGDKPLIFVGKGITFDTGGISLKPNSGMQAMRADCSGAAAVIGVLHAIAKLELKLNVVGLAPLTENMPSSKATKPTDVIFASNGKSVEINNTDAEGRLVLSDALVYAETLNPHTVVDIATLTGAMMVALGDAYIGTYTRSDELWDELNEVGALTHERFWRMPLDPIYRKALKSTIADFKNSGARAGGANTAAEFLGEFITIDRWAHLDIAGVMLSDGKGYKPKGMSGLPVRALFALAQKYQNI